MAIMGRQIRTVFYIVVLSLHLLVTSSSCVDHEGMETADGANDSNVKENIPEIQSEDEITQTLPTKENIPEIQSEDVITQTLTAKENIPEVPGEEKITQTLTTKENVPEIQNEDEITQSLTTNDNDNSEEETSSTADKQEMSSNKEVDHTTESPVFDNLTISTPASLLLKAEVIVTKPSTIPTPTLTAEMKLTIAMLQTQEKKTIFRNNMFTLQELGEGLSIQINGERLNKQYTIAQKISKEEQLSRYLFGQSLEERVAVWGRMAKINRMIHGSQTSSSSVNVDVVRENLLVYDGDILLGIDDVIDIERDVIQDLQNSSHIQKRSIEENPDAFLHNRVKRKFTSRTGRTWTSPIAYSFDANLNSVQRALIRTAIAEWHRETCIRFVERTAPTSPYVHFRTSMSGGFCGASPVGRNTVRNSITIICFNNGVIVHEIGHTIGFWHEHQRSDRDDHVELIEEMDNVNFRKQDTDNYAVPYDVYSVLHYGPGNLRAKDPNVNPLLGQRKGLTFWDSKLANMRYCGRSCGGITLAYSVCRQGGYRDPNNCGRCRCAVGFRDTYCRYNDARPACGSAIRQARQTNQILQSPGFPGFYPRGGEICSWTIQGPTSSYIKARFIERFDLTYSARCTEDFVEVRYRTQKYLQGPRYCGSRLPAVNFVSDNNQLMVVFQIHSGDYTHRGFKMEYNYIQNCGLCTNNYSPNIACRSTTSRTCSTTYTSSCGLFGWRRCTRTRYYACNSRFCCRGNLIGNLCQVSGCGGCSDQVVKNQPNCRRQERRTRSERYMYYTRCGLFRRCARTGYRVQTYYVPVSSYCCNGYSAFSSRCIKIEE